MRPSQGNNFLLNSKGKNMDRIMRANFFRTMGLIIIVVFIVGIGTVASFTKSYPEILLSTSHGLDLSQLHLVVDAPPEYEEQLYKRAHDQLTQADLSIKSKFKNSYKQWEPLFRLIFEVEPVDEISSNLFLYSKRLEIVENVVPERTIKVRAWAVTWSVGSSWPELRRKRLTLVDLEKDLDELLRKFLQDYKYANQRLPREENR